MTKIQKGKEPEVNLDLDNDQPRTGFKVSLQKPSKIKDYLDHHVVGQDRAKNPSQLLYIIIISALFINHIIPMLN